MKRKIRKKLWIATTCFILLIVLGVVILHSPYIKNKILASIQTNLQEGQGIQLSVQSFDYDLLKLRFTLTGIQVQTQGEYGLIPVFRAKEITADIPLSLLVRRKLRIQALSIIEPEINIQIDRNGNSNLPLQKRPEKSPQTKRMIPDFLIEHIEIKNTRISFIDKRNNLEFLLPEIWLNGGGEDFGRHSFRLEMRSPGSVDFRSRSFPLEKCEFEAELIGGVANIKELFLAIANNEIELSGRIEDFSSLFFDGSVQGRLEAEDFRSLVAPDAPFSGEIRFKSHLKGPLRELEARIDMQSQNLRFGKIEDVGMRADFSWKNRTLEILALDLKKENGSIHGEGSLHPLDWEKGNQLALKWEALDVAPFMDLVRSPYLFSARTEGRLKVSWNGYSRDDASGACEVRLTPEEFKSRPEKGISLEGRISATLDSGRLEISHLDISALDAVLGGSLILDSDKLSGKLSLTALSIGKMIPLIIPFAGDREGKDLLGLGINGPVSASVALAGKPGKPEARLNFKSENFKIFKTNGLRVGGTALLDNQNLHVESLSIEDGEGSIAASGIYPIQPSGQAMRFDIQGKELSVERILEILGSGHKAKGSIQFLAKVEGTTDAPRVEAKWSVSHASFYEVNFGLIEGKGGFRNSKFIIDSIRASESTGFMEASGFYDPSGNEFKLLLSGKSFPLYGMQVTADLSELKGELNIELEASGNPRDPRLETTGTLRRISLGARALPDLKFDTRTRQGELEFEVEAPSLSGHIGGAVSLKAPNILRADLAFSRMRLEDLADKILLVTKYDLSGTVTAEAHIEMDLGNPIKSLDCEARIDQVQIKSGDRLLQNDGPVLFSFGSESFRVERLLLTGTGIRIQAGGSLPWNGHSPSKILLSSELDLSLLKDFLPIQESKGFLKMEFQLSGSLSSLEAEAVIDLRGARFQLSRPPTSFEDIQTRLVIEKNLLRVESFSARIAEALFELKGEIPLVSLPLSLPVEFIVSEKEELRLVLTFTHWDPFTLRRLIPIGMLPEAKGTVGGRIEIGGTRLRPADLSVKAFFETIELDIQGISFKQEAASRVVLERGRLSVDALTLRNGENRLDISGTASVTGEKDFNLSLDGEIDNNFLHIFLPEGFFSGKTRFKLQVAQSRTSPEITGLLKIQDGRYQRVFPRILLEQVNGEISFLADRVEIDNIRGVLNGGETSLGGKIGLDGLTLRNADIALKNESSLFDYPKGLSSQISGDLKFLSDGNSHQIAGTITIQDARYRDDFRVGTAVFNLLKRGELRQSLREPNPFLKNLNLDINIGVANNFIIDNNIAKAEISADLRLIGTPYNPSLSGRASIAEGGEVYFSQNTFFLEQGTVDFLNPTRIEPDLNLDARTKVKEYDIRLIVQGTPDNLTASLVSDPAISEPNIISLLVTGRTLDSASAHVLSVAGSTALSYLDNAVTGRIEQATAKALGLESVRIDAGLVSTEENPEARLTVGQHLSRDFELVFSQDLKDTRNQMWIANYNPHKSFNIQGVRRDNNEFNLALRHEIQFGLKSLSKPANSGGMGTKNLVIGSIRLEGNPGLPPGVILQRLKLKKGKEADFAGFQDALERLRRLYQKNNYLSFSLVAKREETNGRLDMILRIDSGPKIFLEYEGAAIPKKMKKEIVDTWAGNPFGQLAMEDIKQRIREYFMEKRYYDVQVSAREKKGDSQERSLIFRTIKGQRFGKPDVRIEGNRALADKVITTHLKKSGKTSSVFYRPMEWVKSIEDLYIRKGYLRPRVQLPVVHFDRDGKKARVQISIDEGTRFEVGNLEIKGLNLFEGARVRDEIGIRPGDTLLPERFYEADQKIHEMYVQKGFNDVRVQSNIQIHEDKGTVDLDIDIQENLRGMIAEISIEGNRLTSERVIRRELKFQVGDALNYRLINETRKRLYDLGVFERVNIDILPSEQKGNNVVEGSSDPKKGDKHLRVLISVAELKPYRLRYGFQYDTESSFGVLASLVNRNFLGDAKLIGASFHLNRDERDTRAFFRSPYFFSQKISTEIFVSNNRTAKPAFIWERTGFTIQQQMKIKKAYVISYNFTFEEIDTSYPVLEGVQNTGTIDRFGTLNAAFTRDTRDDILNATRGMFLSQNIRYAPGIFGSNVHFIRYFGQFNTYQKISDFITYAASVRIGLGKGLNGDLPVSERFFAGGGTTIRGFKKDELGPKDPITGLPLGGDAAFILNQELRFPIFKKFGGVVFLDLGNVYPKIMDFSFFDIRKTAGFGFRLHTPFVLVRFDWGFKLDRLPGESPSQIFFSIGQAF